MLHFQVAKKIWRKKGMVMKILPHVQNCGASTKMPKNWKNNFGNIFKIFFKNRRFTAAFRRFSKNISTIFKKYFENVPKIIFSIFWHFWNRTAILYICWNFHNHRIFSSYCFNHFTAATSVHLFANRLSLNTAVIWTNWARGGSTPGRIATTRKKIE